jgi:hypothetical protein
MLKPAALLTTGTPYRSLPISQVIIGLHREMPSDAFSHNLILGLAIAIPGAFVLIFVFIAIPFLLDRRRRRRMRQGE